MAELRLTTQRRSSRAGARAICRSRARSVQREGAPRLLRSRGVLLRLRHGHPATPAGPSSFGAELYSGEEREALPDAAKLASLGCGNPTAVAELHAGEIVLDLGSGGGIDVLLSARRVGPAGKAYGLDMTDEMLELARANQRRPGSRTSSSSRARSRRIPLPDESVDVVISNCVINLSADKPAGLPRGGPRAPTGRALRGHRHRRRRGHGRGDPAGHGAVDRVHRRRPDRGASSSAS